MEYRHDVESSVALEAGGGGGNLKGSSKEIRHGRTAHNMSSSSLRKKSELVILSKLRWSLLRQMLVNLQEVLLGTKLAVLFPAVPLAFAAHFYDFGSPWIFALSLLGLTPLAERVSFLTEQIAFYTGPTVGGLMNATCGNATELIIAILALYKGKIEVLKCSLLGSVLSNLLLVLGSALFCGGLANLGKEQKYDRKQTDVSCTLLLLGFLSQMLPLILKYSTSDNLLLAEPTLYLSRASSIVMLVAYIAYIIFQLKTHRWLFEPLNEVKYLIHVSLCCFPLILCNITFKDWQHLHGVLFDNYILIVCIGLMKSPNSMSEIGKV
ncbi:Vacuolar cation/proton exchanger 3 [Asimina triloba]